jgi:hypothetical protein
MLGISSFLILLGAWRSCPGGIGLEKVSWRKLQAKHSTNQSISRQDGRQDYEDERAYHSKLHRQGSSPEKRAWSLEEQEPC